MDRSAIRRAISRPRSERRRIRLGDVDRLHPRDDRAATEPGPRSWLARQGLVVKLAVGAAVGAVALAVARALGRR